MRRGFTFAAILSLVLAVSSSVQARHHDIGFSLQLAGSHNSISPDSAVWKVGEPVRVIVAMINGSKRVVHYSLMDPAWDWEMDVRDSAGNPVPETPLYRQIRENLKNGPMVVSRRILGTLRPGEKAQDVIEVQMFYDVSRPGQYTIEVERKFTDVSDEAVKSNRLELTITP